MAGDLIIIGILFIVAVADLLLIRYKQKTISKRFRYWGSQWGSPYYAWGALAGHFGGPSIDIISNRWASVGALILSAIAVSAGHYFLAKRFALKPWFVLIYVPLGIIPGALLWPQ